VTDRGVGASEKYLQRGRGPHQEHRNGEATSARAPRPSRQKASGSGAHPKSRHAPRPQGETAGGEGIKQRPQSRPVRPAYDEHARSEGAGSVPGNFHALTIGWGSAALGPAPAPAAAARSASGPPAGRGIKALEVSTTEGQQNARTCDSMSRRGGAALKESSAGLAAATPEGSSRFHRSAAIFWQLAEAWERGDDSKWCRVSQPGSEQVDGARGTLSARAARGLPLPRASTSESKTVNLVPGSKQGGLQLRHTGGRQSEQRRIAVAGPVLSRGRGQGATRSREAAASRRHRHGVPRRQ